MKQHRLLQPIVFGIALACFISLLFAARIYAQPLDVLVSSAQYTTYVQASDWAWENDISHLVTIACRTNTATLPISDEIAFYTTQEGLPNHTTASAGLFQVSDTTGWGFANAEAISQLWFSPLADQTQSINVHISIGSNHGPWTAGEVSLFDLTSNSQLWNYSWSFWSPGNIPWDDPQSYGTGPANFSIYTDFSTSHTYELIMQVSSNAGDDSQQVQMQLTGLQVVPEPSTVLLLAMSGAALAIYRRRR